MQNPMEINLSQIPPAESRNLAISFLEAIRKFYDDPKNEAEFQAWKKQREKQ